MSRYFLGLQLSLLIDSMLFNAVRIDPGELGRERHGCQSECEHSRWYKWGV